MRTLTPTTEGFRALLTAWQKARSIAAEGGYSTMGADFAALGVRDPEWAISDDRTGDLLIDLITGKRECEPLLWLNLTRMVDSSDLWLTGLAVNGWELPSRADVLAQLANG